MKKFQDKKKRRQMIYSLGSVLGLLLLTLILAKATANIYIKHRESVELKAQVENRLANLQEREQRLSEETEKLQSQEGVEEEIRNKFNVIKPGERVMIIVDQDGEATTTEDESFVARVVRFFK